MPDVISRIKASRDLIVAGLNTAITEVGQELAGYTTRDDYLMGLSRRLQALTNERAEVYERASNSILELPEVQAAAKTLVNLGEQMTTAAAKMKGVTKTLSNSTKVLTIAGRFLDTVATSQKKA